VFTICDNWGFFINIFLLVKEVFSKRVDECTSKRGSLKNH